VDVSSLRSSPDSVSLSLSPSRTCSLFLGLCLALSLLPLHTNPCNCRVYAHPISLTLTMFHTLRPHPSRHLVLLPPLSYSIPAPSSLPLPFSSRGRGSRCMPQERTLIIFVSCFLFSFFASLSLAGVGDRGVCGRKEHRFISNSGRALRLQQNCLYAFPG
jgi:hypothetical protein